MPWDAASNFKAACDRKLAQYERLALDIKENGYSVANMPLEIGCRGVIDKRNALILETICNLVGIKALKTSFDTLNVYFIVLVLETNIIHHLIDIAKENNHSLKILEDLGKVDNTERFDMFAELV